MRPPPIRIDVSQRTILGLSYRQIIILAVAAFLALAVFAGLNAVPVFLRGALTVLCAGIGLALAFGEIGGKTPEAWLLDLFSFRRRPRYLVHRAMRAEPETKATLPQSDTAPMKAATSMPITASPLRNFFILTANAIALSFIVGMTLYLLDGGAQRLLGLWWGF